MKKLLVFLTVMTFMFSFVAANTVDSSTMVFEGALTANPDGSYSGTIDATPGNYYIIGGPGEGEYVGPNPSSTEVQGGFDLYAEEGENAFVEGMSPETALIGSDNDAYSQSGPWGTYYNPDIADWYNYQLTLNGGNWYLEYKNSELGTPMSGAIDWGDMYASEDDVGSYRGTASADPDANDGGAAANGGGAATWDMDWTWGSEVIPLEYPGFRVNVENISTVSEVKYRVTLTPADDSPDNQGVTGDLEDYSWSISVTPDPLTFETIPRGTNIVHDATNGPVKIDATGSQTASDNVYVTVDVIGEDAGFYDDLLEFVYNSAWTDVTALPVLEIPETSYRNYNVRLHGDTSNLEGGAKTATIVYTAYGEAL